MKKSLSLGQTYKGFLLTKELPLKELHSTLLELVHEQSGARVIQIANDDPENLFSLSFQTLPDSSNGVAHILEHTVLCGSKRFPIKDPFFSMTRRSLNTYMNALTGQDFTCYPAASQVEKDFYNLLEVYLDAVFEPQLKRLSFLQEGHRLAFAEKDNPESALTIQGVVYNEMKGAMSSIDSRLFAQLFKELLPDLPYAHNSGGDPKEIPNLTYEELIEFHRTFYHPSRCLFFFYGNIPLVRHLDFIEERTLRGVAKVPLVDPLPLQARFTSKRSVEGSYPLPPGEDSAEKTIVALGYLTASISSQQELLALSLIDLLLMDNDASPLKAALLHSKLLKAADSSFDIEMSEAPWVLVCKGCASNAAEPIEHLVRQTLEKLAHDGFDEASIEACLHQIEFDRTEIGGEGVPFGLSLFFRAALSKQHGADPESALLIHSLFRELREQLKDPNYLPSLLRRHFLDNPHCVLLALRADPELEKREKEEEEHRIKKIRAHLSQEDIAALLKQEKELAHYQEQIEQQSIDCLPKISLSDVPAQAKDYPLIRSDKGLEIFRHPCFTNRIVYADLVFNLPKLSEKELCLFSFLTRIMTEVGSGSRNYQQTLALQQSCVGELSATASLFIQHGDPRRGEPALVLRGKALMRNVPQFFSLLQDTARSLQLKDDTRIKDLLHQHATQLSNRIVKQALSYAIQLATSGFSLPAAIQQHWQGLTYFQAVQQWAKEEKPLSHALEAIYRTLFRTKPTLVLACAEEEFSQLHIPQFDGSAHAAELPQAALVPVAHQGRIIASPVAFTALAYQTVSYQDLDSAFLLIATDLLENVVLHNEIREKGGAYGGGAAYSPATGHFHFYGYRDPSIARSYNTFLKAAERMAAMKFSERELEEAKLGILQDIDAPLPPGQRASAAYGWHRSLRTYERRNAYRHSILSATRKEIAAAVEKHLVQQKERAVLVTFANEDLLRKEAKKLPFALEILATL